MIEKLGITQETYGEAYCEMLEALINETIQVEKDAFGSLTDKAYKNMVLAIEKATGHSWKSVKKIVEKDDEDE